MNTTRNTWWVQEKLSRWAKQAVDFKSLEEARAWARNVVDRHECAHAEIILVAAGAYSGEVIEIVARQ